MAEEIRIRIVPEMAGDGLKQAQQEITNLRRAADTYEAKGMPEAAASARREAQQRETEVRRREREKRKEQRDQEKREQEEQKGEDAAAQRTQGRRDFLNQLHVLERRAAGNTKEAAALERSAQIRARSVALEQQLGFSREKAVQLATREADAIERVGRRNAMMRVGGTLATAGIALAGTAVEEYSEQFGIQNRDAAARAINARNLSLHRERGYTAGNAIGDVRATEDRIFEREQQRAELERAARFGPLEAGLHGASAGAAAGAALGSFIPGIGTLIGAGVGGLAGGLYGGVTNYLGGRRALKESDMAQTRDRELLEKQKKEQRALFEQEGLREIEISERIAKGEMGAARATKARLDYHREIAALRGAGATQEESIRGADAKFSAEIRSREQALGGLISARTGAASAARIAGLGDRQFAEAREAVAAQKLEELRQDMNHNHNQATATAGLKSSSRPSLSVQP